MTLFLQTPTRKICINEAYVVAVTFIIFYWVGKIIKRVIEKKLKTDLSIIPDTRGGGFSVEFNDEHELGMIILSCIKDNEKYMVNNNRLKQVIFSLVKEKIQNESLVLTPNMMRFIALRLIDNDTPMVTKIGNVIVSSESRSRLIARLAGTMVFSLFGSIFSALPYVVLMTLIYFNITSDCMYHYQCQNYFDQLPKDEVVTIYGKTSNGHIAITGQDEARQVEIYTETKAESVIKSDSCEIKTTKNYARSRKKAKVMTFEKFKKTDPVLSAFKDQMEPQVPEKKCLVNDVHDVIAIKID